MGVENIRGSLCVFAFVRLIIYVMARPSLLGSSNGWAFSSDCPDVHHHFVYMMEFFLTVKRPLLWVI